MQTKEQTNGGNYMYNTLDLPPFFLGGGGGGGEGGEQG